jgi:hypothetical protein
MRVAGRPTGLRIQLRSGYALWHEWSITVLLTDKVTRKRQVQVGSKRVAAVAMASTRLAALDEGAHPFRPLLQPSR